MKTKGTITITYFEDTTSNLKIEGDLIPIEVLGLLESTKYSFLTTCVKTNKIYEEKSV
jgi:hypothetical protein